jgi:membrane protein DedA with SNARE-associated domain
MFARYGLPALFVARFVPGVRAVVPVAAGALKLPAFRTTVLMALAAAIWYGAIEWVAYRFSAVCRLMAVQPRESWYWL